MTLMRVWLLILLLARVARAQELAVSAYLPEYRSYIDVNATAPFLTDLVLFSLKPHSRGMVGGCCLSPSHYEQARQAKAHTGGKLRLWVSIGGVSQD